MMEPVFLTLSDALEIHAEQIDLYGGEAGIRDTALLESALAVPLAGMGGAYFHNDIFAMAAAYLFHIVQNHPFLDGNKRTGLACAYLFMAINGFELDCDAGVLANMVLEVARSEMGKEEIVDFFQRYVIEQRQIELRDNTGQD